MLSKVSDWVFGSFFRTIGRILVFVILGVIISHFIDFGSIADNFRITDLFFDKVKASTFSYGYINNMYNSSGQTIPPWPNYAAYNYIQNTNTENDIWFNSSHNDNSHGMSIINGVNYLHFTILINPQIDGLTCSIGSSTKQLTGTWTNTSTGEGGSIAPIIYQYNTMECADDNNTFSVVMRQQGDNFNFGVPCSIYGLTNNANGANFANVSCPVLDNAKWVSRITFFKLGTTASVAYGLNRTFYGEKPDGTSITNAINSQIQQEQQQHQQIMDSNTTQTESEASDFFSDFSVTDHGGLASILTAPLTIFNSILNDSCVPATFTYRNKQVSLPCGQTFWNQAPNVRDWLSTIESGIIAYCILISLFKLIQKLESPSNSEVEVESL